MNIIKYPDKKLRLKCKEVKRIDASVRKKANELLLALKTMNKSFISPKGIAANQIGLNKRIIIIKRFGNKFVFGNKFIIMINPKIISSYITLHSIDVCASIPKVIRINKRKLIIRVKYLGLDNKIHKITLFGTTSFTMQQEIDHLNGKLIVD